MTDVQPPSREASGDRDIARQALACLDLTSLRGDEDDAAIDALVARAAHPVGPPAALCVHPAAVARARRGLDARGLDRVRVATVVGFPHGDSSPQRLEAEITEACALGADEIDMVIPWAALRAAARLAPFPDKGGSASLQGLSAASAEAAVRACVAAARSSCDAAAARADAPRPLKVIIESGELHDPALIALATRLALEQGADYVKTSTGKASVHATPEAVRTMLEVLGQIAPGRGLKVAGGVQTLADVRCYLGLVEALAGPAGLAPGRLRFGASSLWPVLRAAIEGPGRGSPVPAASDTY